MKLSKEDQYPTSIRVHRSLRRYLRYKSRKQGCSMAFMINQIVREALEAELAACGGDEAKLYRVREYDSDDDEQ